MSDEIKAPLIRCEICALAHDPQLGQCTGDVEYERTYRAGYDRGQAEQEQEIQRLRTVIASCATIEVASMKAEIQRLRARVAELETPSWYWDERNMEAAVEPSEVVAFDDIDDILPFRPLHELPTAWALVTADGPEWFASEEAAAKARADYAAIRELQAERAARAAGGGDECQ